MEIFRRRHPEPPAGVPAAPAATPPPADMVTAPVELAADTSFPYHRTKDIIEQAVAGFGDETGGEEMSGISFSREKNTSRINLEIPNGTDLYPVIAEIVRVVGDSEISHSYGGNFYLSRKGGLYVWIDKPRPYSHGSIGFSKDKDLEAQEIEAIIKCYKIINSSSERRRESPESVLESLGATIFKPGEAPGWDYLAGYDEVKQQVRETVILALQHPEIYEQIARRTRKAYESNRPKAVLFEGPPGTGKTTIAKIIAGEVDAKLVYVPVESIMSMWYGESENNLADIFRACTDMGNSLLFLDEIDSLATSRQGGMHEATRRILSVLLRNIDGFIPTEKTILIGATNRKADLDPALLSRFDISIEFPLPDVNERQAIFANYAMHLSPEELTTLSQRAEGLSGRDIKNLCERTERRLASELIAKGQDLAKPPTLEMYLVWLTNN
jgi:ATPase family associated with various cellular activities (AAA)